LVHDCGGGRELVYITITPDEHRRVVETLPPWFADLWPPARQAATAGIAVVTVVCGHKVWVQSSVHTGHMSVADLEKLRPDDVRIGLRMDEGKQRFLTSDGGVVVDHETFEIFTCEAFIGLNMQVGGWSVLGGGLFFFAEYTVNPNT
jgi:hypothetical protein